MNSQKKVNRTVKREADDVEMEDQEDATHMQSRRSPAKVSTSSSTNIGVIYVLRLRIE